MMSVHVDNLFMDGNPETLKICSSLRKYKSSKPQQGKQRGIPQRNLQ